MIAGIALLAAALSLFIYNSYDAYRADTYASGTLSTLRSLIDDILNDGENADEDEAVASEDADSENPGDLEYVCGMPVLYVNGNAYIGYVTIDSIDISLPVASDWDYDKLKISPCRYSGSYTDDDLVIAAHNYRRHFGLLKTLNEGASVIFTDVLGNETEYEVKKVEVLSSTSVDEMTAGEYDLTLFTCTYGGVSRVTVRCDRK